MLGKGLLLSVAVAVLFCVSVVHGKLVQDVRCEGDKESRKGVIKTFIVRMSAESELKRMVELYSTIAKGIQCKTAEYIQKAERDRCFLRQSIQKVTDVLKKEAAEFRRPQTVYTSLMDREAKAIRNVSSYIRTFKTDAVLTETSCLNDIEGLSAAWKQMNEEQQEKHKDVLCTIENTRDKTCIDNALTEYETWFKEFSDRINEIKTKMLCTSNYHSQDIVGYYLKCRKDAFKSRNESIQKMRACLDI